LDASIDEKMSAEELAAAEAQERKARAYDRIAAKVDSGDEWGNVGAYAAGVVVGTRALIADDEKAASGEGAEGERFEDDGGRAI
jgi:hypothetical protein